MNYKLQKTTKGGANFSLGVNYMGVGLNLGYSSAPKKTETMTIEQPQITYNQPMGIEGNYPRFDNRSIGAPSSRGNQPLALGAPSSRDHRAYANEGRPSRDHRAYTDEGRSSRGNQPLALGAPSSRDHRAYANEGRPSRGNQPLALGSPSSRDGNRSIEASRGPVQTSLLPSNPHSFTEEIPSSPGWLQTPNVAFYQNKIPAKPNHECIEEILTKWAGDYRKLMENCHYIQWLFPNRMPGINKEAHILTDEEAPIIEDTPVLRERVKRAFVMMLDFYGMTLTWNNQIQLSETPKQRLKQLNQKDNHHFMCISRILLALKELGHHNLMLPWMKCLADLIYKENRLNHARFSFENHWIDILDAADKIQLTALINSYNI